MKRIAVVGSRPPKAGCAPGDWLLWDWIIRDVRRFVRALPPDVMLISGGAVGVDAIAEEEAQARRLSRCIFEPLDPAHPGALHARNSRIVAFLDGPTMVIEGSGTPVFGNELHAWPSPWGRGTQSTIEKAHAAGVRVEVHERQGR